MADATRCVVCDHGEGSHYHSKHDDMAWCDECSGLFSKTWHAFVPVAASVPVTASGGRSAEQTPDADRTPGKCVCGREAYHDCPCKELDARVAELERVIEEAPHGSECDFRRDYGADEYHHGPCDCWKASVR